MDERQRFQAVVLPHLDDALSLARWLTGNAADAEDVVQEACLRAFGAIETVRDASPRAWLLTIVRNTAYSWLAKNRPKMLVVTDDDRVFEQAAGGEREQQQATPESAMLAKADSEALASAIAALPLAFREVLVLREIDDLSYREISQVMSIPMGTVMSRLGRARALLLQNLNRQGVADAGPGRSGKAGTT